MTIWGLLDKSIEISTFSIAFKPFGYAAAQSRTGIVGNLRIVKGLGKTCENSLDKIFRTRNRIVFAIFEFTFELNFL